MEPLISVIVPVYNVAAWLPRCVNSILTQTHDPAKNLAELLEIYRLLSEKEH